MLRRFLHAGQSHIIALSSILRFLMLERLASSRASLSLAARARMARCSDNVIFFLLLVRLAIPATSLRDNKGRSRLSAFLYITMRIGSLLRKARR